LHSPTVRPEQIYASLRLGIFLASTPDSPDQLGGLDRRRHPMSEICDYEEELLGWQRHCERQRRPFQFPNAVRVVQPPRTVDGVLRGL
jgi:hypothetical protein